MHLYGDEENAVLKGPQKRPQKIWASFQYIYIESTTNVFIIEGQQLGESLSTFTSEF